MIKGINKKMVVIKNVGSPIFEEAHFIIRDGAVSSFSNGSIITEANRIVSKSLILSGKQSKRKSRVKPLLFGTLLFLLGIALGAVIALLVS